MAKYNNKLLHNNRRWCYFARVCSSTVVINSVKLLVSILCLCVYGIDTNMHAILPHCHVRWIQNMLLERCSRWFAGVGGVLSPVFMLGKYQRQRLLQWWGLDVVPFIPIYIWGWCESSIFVWLYPRKLGHKYLHRNVFSSEWESYCGNINQNLQLKILCWILCRMGFCLRSTLVEVV